MEYNIKWSEMMNFPRQFLKPLNFLIPKKKYHIYSVPHINGLADCYDLLNYGSDNLLCVLHELLEGQYKKKLTIYIECYSRERIPIIKEYLARTSNQSINIIPIESYLLKEERKPSVVRRIKNTFIRYQCSLWLSDTGFCYFQDKLWCQKHVCLNYSTPLKAIRGINWKNDFSNIDGYIETSLLTSYIHSAGFKVKLDNCLILGFPRNDILFYSKNLSKVKKWIEMRAKEKYKKIIVYAPTYREYKSAYVSKCVFGYDDPENKLEKFLSKEKILIVVKMHPLQEYGEFIYSDHVIPYEANYNFSFYDLLALSDLLVSDYSSVIHDYILTGKNVVLNFFDRDRFDESRGFIFEPLEYVCPGPIAENLDALISNINNALTNSEIDTHYEIVRNMFHRNLDAQSTQRVVDYILRLLQNELLSRI